MKVFVLPSVTESKTQAVERKLESIIHKPLDLDVIDAYNIKKEVDFEKIATAISSPLTQRVSNSLHSYSWLIEISMLPNVTDNVGKTASESLEAIVQETIPIRSSQIILIHNPLEEKEIEKIASALHNPVIQEAYITNGTYQNKKFPEVIIEKVEETRTVNLEITDEELEQLGKYGIEGRGPLSLSLKYMKIIKEHFKSLQRSPTEVELEMIAQTQSEHCKHNIFSAEIDGIQSIYETYIKRATKEINKKSCISTFTDNAGIISFDGKHNLAFKVETHNSPSALDPFGGAETGIVGVNRDIIGAGLGAKPIINTYGFCFGFPDDNIPLFRDKETKKKIIMPKKMMEGVIRGLNEGGNCSGIPTTKGFTIHDNRYKGKPLVFVGTVGLIPKKSGRRKLHEKKASANEYIVVVGGKVGLDGIHGATFSSESLEEKSPITAVQIGDPITQKKLSDALIKEARDRELYTSITDNGAGGLSCSVAEMAEESRGCKVELEKVPLKYKGLAPWQVWLSESQERMTLSVPREKWEELKELMDAREVEATIIGEFTDTGKCVVTHENKEVVNLDLEFLHNGFTPPLRKTKERRRTNKKPEIKQKKEYTETLARLLSHPDITSKLFITQQYDHEVQGGSVLKPIQGKGMVDAPATISRPILASKKGVVLSQSTYPSYGDIDTYDMVAAAIDTTIRNIVACGGSMKSIALLDNFCWCSSNEPERLYELVRAAEACYETAIEFQTPFISGKDSMYNDFVGYNEKGEKVKISVPPTVLISGIGIIENCQQAISIDFKKAGDLIYLLGSTKHELGGSAFYGLHNEIGNTVPYVDAQVNKTLYGCVEETIKKELITSAMSVERGGLAIALAKSAIAGQVGIEIQSDNELYDYTTLFSESQGRIIVSVNPKKKKEFEKIMQNTTYQQLGKIREDLAFSITSKDRRIINTNIPALTEKYHSTFRGWYT